MSWLLVGLVLAGACLVLYHWLRRKVTSHLPATFPSSDYVQKQNAAGKSVLVLAGDSLTHGNVSANYVEMLENWLPESTYLLYNAGKNADLTFTLRRRLDTLIACKPNFITLLIGTNDVHATMSPANLKHYRDIGRIEPADQPSFETFRENYQAIVRRLKTETSARIAVLSLPPISEDLTHEVNRRADQYSEAMRQIAQEEGVDYLPVRETMKAYLKAHPKKSRVHYEQTYLLLNLMVARHYLLGQSWDTICMNNGNDLTPDNLHLNTRGAAMIATSIEGWLNHQQTDFQEKVNTSRTVKSYE